MIKTIEHSPQGEILCIHLSPKGGDKSLFLNSTLIVDSSLEVLSSDYIKDNKVTKRPLFDVTVDGLTVSGIPIKTEIYIDGDLVGKCDTGSITLEKENPIDSVTVRLSLFPYIDKEITL